MRARRSLQRQMVWLAATFLLAVMLLLMLASAQEDSLTFDEPAHIASGYASLRYRDARLNHEHPPLGKMLAALPLLAVAPHFPLASSAWQEANNGQWETARIFLYESGNDPHHITALARLGPMAIALSLGLVLFLWTRRWAGEGSALLTLFLTAFSPTVLAHGRLVTTDVAAAFGVLLAGLAFMHFLTAPGIKTGFMAGTALGIALLCKFSTILLVPLMAGCTLLWMCLEPGRVRRYLLGIVLIGVNAALLVLLCYLWTTGNYPPERQFRDTYMALFWLDDGPMGRTHEEPREVDFPLLQRDPRRDVLACAGLRPARGISRLKRCPSDVVIFMADKPLLRAWGHYLYGVIWTVQRASLGTSSAFPFYFLGEVSTTGQASFFPIVYAVKEPLASSVLIAAALALVLRRLRSGTLSLGAAGTWLRGHPTDTFMLGWLALYWYVSITANLNIGVRHLVPVFPFTFMLVGREVSRWLTDHGGRVFPRKATVRVKGMCVASLLLWQAMSVVSVFPSFLAYFNEASGGPEEGGRYVVDSNLDWGQDLRRLGAFVETEGIEKIAVDYFGQSSPAYELGEKYVPWRSALGPYRGWWAVSATVLMVAQARWAPDLGHRVEDSYQWLRDKAPVAKIGYSIFVFDLRTSR
jgi:4-amino-4-deoxy-L-arabinose transferase-like glycosyltransferase